MGRGARGALIVVLLLAAIAAAQGWLGARTTTWTPTTGEITQAEIRPHAGPFEERRWHLSVRYRYQVDGRAFEGTQITAGGLFGAGVERATDPASGIGVLERLFWWVFPLPTAPHPDDLLPWSALYPVGRTVSVFHHPDDPSRAVLTQEYANPWLRAAIVLGILAIVWITVAALFRWLGELAGGFPGLRRLGRLVAFGGLALGLFGLWRGELAARSAPPPLPDAGSCAWEGAPSRFVALPRPIGAAADSPTATGLVAPAFASCGDPTQTPKLGCIMELNVPTLAGAIELQERLLAPPPDDPGFRTVLLPPSAERPTVAILARFTGGEDGAGGRFRGRLVALETADRERPGFASFIDRQEPGQADVREAAVTDPPLAGLPLAALIDRTMPAVETVLLADRAIVMPAPARLVELDRCAVLRLPAGIEAIERASVRSYRPGRDGEAREGLDHFLEGLDAVTYRKQARAGWDLLSQLGFGVALSMLVPLLLHITRGRSGIP